jgi:hypothetical protein
MVSLPNDWWLGTGRSEGGKRWVKTAFFRATNLFGLALGRSKSRRFAGLVPVFYCYCLGYYKKVYFVDLPLNMSSDWRLGREKMKQRNCESKREFVQAISLSFSVRLRYNSRESQYTF